MDEPLQHMLTDPRSPRLSTVDRLWVRLVDVDRALEVRRYSAPLDVVLVEELRPGALARASAAFRGDREPFHPGGRAFPLY